PGAPDPTLFPYTTLFRSASAARITRRARPAPAAAFPRPAAPPRRRAPGQEPARSVRRPARPAPAPRREPGQKAAPARTARQESRSEEHTSELQSLAYLVC